MSTTLHNSPRHRKRRKTTPVVESFQRRSGIRLSAQVLLLAVLLISPWTLGGVDYHTQTYLFAGLIISSLLWFLSMVCDAEPERDRSRLPMLLLPLVLGVIYGSLQLIPIASFSETQLGPQSDLIQNLEQGAGLVRHSISIYPLETRVQIATLSFALLAFFLATQLFSSRKSQVWLFGALAVSGLALSFFGIAQKLSWNGHLFWTGPEVVDGKPFASYVNRNNAAGYLNLTLGAAFGYLIWSTYRISRRSRFEYSSLSDGLDLSPRDRFNAFAQRLGELSGAQLLAGTSILMIVAGILASASRGGILALMIGLAAVVCWMWFGKYRQMALSLLLVMLIPGLILISWLGLSQNVRERFTELNATSVIESGRIQNWSEALRSLPEIWSTGSGLGTYNYFYRPYQQHGAKAVFYHAENQYVETLIEAGAVGLILLLAVLLLAAITVFRLSRSRLTGKADGVACVGLFILVTQAAHAFLDFGLYLPANMLTMAVLMGAVSGRAVRKLANASGNWYFALPSLQPRVVFALFSILLIGNSVLGWIELSRAAIADDAVFEARHLDDDKATSADYRARIKQLLKAIDHRPDDVELHLHLADIYMRLYGLQTRELIVEQLPEGRELTEVQLRSLSSISELYRRVCQMEQAGLVVQVERMRDDPLIQETLIPARSALLAAQSACGWLPQVELYLSYLSVLAEPAQQRINRLKRVAYLASYESRYLFPAGSMALAAGDYDLGIQLWNRTFEIDPQQRFEILARGSALLPISMLVDRVVPDDPEILKSTVSSLHLQKAHRNVVEGLVAKINRLLASKSIPPGEVAHFLAGFSHQWRGDDAAAATEFEKALEFDSADGVTQFALARSLVELGQFRQAETHLDLSRELNTDPNEVKWLENQLASASIRHENGSHRNSVKENSNAQ